MSPWALVAVAIPRTRLLFSCGGLDMTPALVLSCGGPDMAPALPHFCPSARLDGSPPLHFEPLLQHSHDRFAALDPVAHAHPDLRSLGHNQVRSRAKPDQAVPLAGLELVTLPHPADDAPRDHPRDLLHADPG